MHIFDRLFRVKPISDPEELQTLENDPVEELLEQKKANQNNNSENVLKTDAEQTTSAIRDEKQIKLESVNLYTSNTHPEKIVKEIEEKTSQPVDDPLLSLINVSQITHEEKKVSVKINDVNPEMNQISPDPNQRIKPNEAFPREKPKLDQIDAYSAALVREQKADLIATVPEKSPGLEKVETQPEIPAVKINPMAASASVKENQTASSFVNPVDKSVPPSEGSATSSISKEKLGSVAEAPALPNQGKGIKDLLDVFKEDSANKQKVAAVDLKEIDINELLVQAKSVAGTLSPKRSYH